MVCGLHEPNRKPPFCSRIAETCVFAHTCAELYQDDQLVAPEGHFPFEEVLERAATSEQVTFVGEVTAFKEQIASSLSSAACYETLPDAVKIGRLGLKQAPASLHDFVPHYLKRVEAEENWLKDHTETTTSYIKRL